jgi:hypothetical protein
MRKPGVPWCSAVRYGSERRALVVLAELQAAGRQVRRAYPCDDCNGWHLTSMARPPERVRQA